MAHHILSSINRVVAIQHFKAMENIQIHQSEKSLMGIAINTMTIISAKISMGSAPENDDIRKTSWENFSPQKEISFSNIFQPSIFRVLLLLASGSLCTRFKHEKKTRDSLPYQRVQDFSHRQYQPPFLAAIKINQTSSSH